ncbi:MAG: hypothetical protein U0935_13250 [Pirellulales bacterium]
MFRQRFATLQASSTKVFRGIAWHFLRLPIMAAVVIGWAVATLLPLPVEAQLPRSQVANEALAQGQLAMEREAWDEAEVYFRRAHMAEPRDPLPLLQLGRLHDLVGNDLTAVGYYRAFLAAAPSSPLVPDVTARFAPLEAAADRRISELLELATQALRAMPDYEVFAHYAERDPIPWYARYAALCSVHGDASHLVSFSQSAREPARTQILFYDALAHQAVGDDAGALDRARQIEPPSDRWQAYLRLAGQTLDGAPGEVEKTLAAARQLSTSRGDSPDDPEVRGSENVLQLFAATIRLRSGQPDEAQRLLSTLSPVPTPETACTWLVTAEHQATLRLAREFACQPAPAAAFELLGRAQKLYALLNQLAQARRADHPGQALVDPLLAESTLHQLAVTREIVTVLVYEALDAGDWDRAARYAFELDEAAYGTVLLQRAGLEVRLGRLAAAQATIARFQRQLDRITPAVRTDLQRRYELEVEFPQLSLEQVRERAQGDRTVEERDDAWLARLAKRQLAQGDINAAQQTTEGRRYESDRGAGYLELVIALAARGDLPTAQAMARRIVHPSSSQRAASILLEAQLLTDPRHDPLRTAPVDLLGAERAWDGPDWSAVTLDLVTFYRERGELLAAAQVNLRQADPVVAARCAGQIARAQLARGEATAADTTVRQFIEQLYPDTLLPFLALAEELAVGGDILGLRTVATRAVAVFRQRSYRCELRQLAQLQEWAGDASGAATTRAAAETTSLTEPRQPPACARFPQYWLNVLVQIESRTLPGAPTPTMFGIGSERSPKYFDVPQRATEQRRILRQLSSSEGTPEQAFQRLCGLASQTWSGLYTMRQAVPAGESAPTPAE